MTRVVSISLFFVFVIFLQSFQYRLGKKINNAESQSVTVNADTVVSGASIPPEIENPELLGINKEPWHATLMVYGNQAEALKAMRHASSYCKSLNGPWKFNWVACPQQRPVDFYKPNYDVSGRKEISVPSNWQVLAIGLHITATDDTFSRKIIRM